MILYFISGDDSFNSFEEMLKLAKKQKVDFILLAGDLFHDGKPTTNTVNRCMALLRHYCMGER
jgi:double-strand break repair protein MRE11